jgi:FkbM family methyltransferase
MSNYIILTGQFLFNFWASLRRTYWSLIRSKLTEQTTFRVTKYDKIRLYNYGDIAAKLYSSEPMTMLDKGFEYRTFQLMKENVAEGNTVLDIGANIGIYSILLSRLVGKTGKVYAFEPDPITVEYLKKNIRLNKCENVIIVPVALSSQNGKITLLKPEGSGDAFNYISHTNRGNTSEAFIDSLKLDDYVDQTGIKKIDFVKIDVEGAELLSFTGAKNVLEKFTPKIIMECYEPYLNRFEHTVADVIIYLHQFGYKFNNYEEQQWLLSKK